MIAPLHDHIQDVRSRAYRQLTTLRGFSGDLRWVKFMVVSFGGIGIWPQDSVALSLFLLSNRTHSASRLARRRSESLSIFFPGKLAYDDQCPFPPVVSGGRIPASLRVKRFDHAIVLPCAGVQTRNWANGVTKL
jgi:hypothetical protein